MSAKAGSRLILDVERQCSESEVRVLGPEADSRQIDAAPTRLQPGGT